MALRIVFDEGVQRNIRPGSVLSGDVVLLAATQQALEEVSITFAGRCKVSQKRSNGQTVQHFYSKGYYFSQRQQLHRGDFTFRAGTYRWPFRFVVPKHADRRPIHSHKGKGDTFDPSCPWRGTGSEEHPLPPTFSGPTSSGSNHCSVEYYLKAELTQGGGLFSRTIEEKAMLHFQPLSLLVPAGFDQSFQKHNRTFSIQTLKLLPEDSEERNSLRHKLKGVFSSSSFPQLRLQVDVRIPRRVAAVPGAAFPCLVAVRTCGTGTTDDPRQVPQSSVLIRRFELELRYHTATRTRHHQDNKRRTEGLAAGQGAAIPIQKADNGSGGKAKLASGTAEGDRSTAATDVGALYGARMPADITPDFSTYNIAHYHTLELKLRLECAGEGMKFDICNLPLEIIPQIAPENPPAWEPYPGTGSVSAEHQDDVVAPPPLYMQGEAAPTYREGLEKEMPESKETRDGAKAPP